jgi:hypothetical protein
MPCLGEDSFASTVVVNFTIGKGKNKLNSNADGFGQQKPRSRSPYAGSLGHQRQIQGDRSDLPQTPHGALASMHRNNLVAPPVHAT